MKAKKLALVTLVLSAIFANPAFASNFLIDFENNWVYGTDISNYYNGGTASDGSSGTNFGVSFTSTANAAMLVLSNNDGLGSLPNGDYYSNAPSSLGTASAFGTDPIYMNVATGVDSSLYFYYSSPQAISGAVKAYSGLNGTGSLLGSLDLAGNNNGLYTTWSLASFSFAGTAQSFDFSATQSVAGLDNISNTAPVPEPKSYTLMLLGLGLFAIAAKRNKKA